MFNTFLNHFFCCKNLYMFLQMECRSEHTSVRRLCSYSIKSISVQLPNIHFSNSESFIGYRELLFFKWLYNHYNSITPRSLPLSYLICPDPQSKFLLVWLLNFKQKINGNKTTDSTELIVLVFVVLISGDHF